MAVPKRHHSKSRRGCSQCRQKHLKCDEIAPICGRCVRRSIKCDFQDWNLAPRNFEQWKPEPEASQKSVGSTKKPQQQSESSSASTLYSAEDVLLMNHYTLDTCRDLGPIADERYTEAWQKAVPVLAQSCPFLLHAILAAAACHKASLASSESDSYIATGRRHHCTAMRLFRACSSTLAPKMACAILPFSILVLLVTFFLDQNDPSRLADPVGSLVDYLAVSRSSFALIGTVMQRVMESSVGVLLDHKQHIQCLPIPTVVSDALETVDKQLISGNLSVDEREACQIALIQLRNLYCRVGIKPRDWAHLLGWALRLDPHFFNLLKCKKPSALVILAHWCILLHHAPERWFFSDIAMRTIHAIANETGSTPWCTVMAWPLAQIGGC